MRYVLFVDQSNDEREMYAYWFQRLGFTTLQADNADDGYRLAVEQSPEVVITELRLPGKEDGLVLTRRLKEHRFERAVRVVILSSPVQGADDAIRGSGCDLHLVKPCLPQALVTAVAHLLARV